MLLQPKTLLARLALWVFGLFGWRVVHAPLPSRKIVLVGAPHTSNWDFWPAMLWIAASGLRVRWVGKAELFRGPLGAIMAALGGLPVARDGSKNLVQRIAELFWRDEELVLLIAAEGTRAYTPHWRTGFYYIALEAGVPIGLGMLDHKRRILGIGAYLMPTGEIEKDFLVLADFYKDVQGHDPSKQGPVVPKPRDASPIPETQETKTSKGT